MNMNLIDEEISAKKDKKKAMERIGIDTEAFVDEIDGLRARSASLKEQKQQFVQNLALEVKARKENLRLKTEKEEREIEEELKLVKQQLRRLDSYRPNLICRIDANGIVYEPVEKSAEEKERKKQKE